MDNYTEFLASKTRYEAPSGFDVPVGELNPGLFEFQALLVRWALRRGRAAIFASTGLGKTAMQCVWADEIARRTDGPVLILAPLCVSLQTVREAAKFEIPVMYQRHGPPEFPITVTNYEMMGQFDLSAFSGIVLDESSILKHHDAKTRRAILDGTSCIPYRLSCTATPAPNDFMEFGGQADFLGIMTQTEMLSRFFIHDGGETQKWRLKGHAEDEFWHWVASWGAIVNMPSDLGYPDDGFVLPPLHTSHHVVEYDKTLPGELFAKEAATLMERNAARRETVGLRADACAELVNGNAEQWLVWCHLNAESDALAARIPDAVAVKGSDSVDSKESATMAFTEGRCRVLITKPSICGWGMNWQHCANMAFVGMNDSFEAYHQAVRRCWRFGQKRPVYVHIVSASVEGAVIKNIEMKEERAKIMTREISEKTGDYVRQEVKAAAGQKDEYREDATNGPGWWLHLGDCVTKTSAMDDGSIDYTIFSPPFSSLYTYSNSMRDMGNSGNDGEFLRHFSFLVMELFRVTRPGRLCSFHCMNIPAQKSKDGYIGLKDFRGDLIRLFMDAGWIYHSEVCIWKDPVTAMQRTKAIGLLHKQLKKDAALARQGIPDYVVTMRKPGDNDKPIENTNQTFPVKVWQNYASPIWMDINPSDTLQFRTAREQKDERHIAPLQLEVIRRCIRLWSREDDLVLSPFAGIGSEGFVAIQMGRRFVGVELKKSYFDLAVKNLHTAKAQQGRLFA